MRPPPSGPGFTDALQKVSEAKGIKIYRTGIPAEATDLKPQLLDFKGKNPMPELLVLAVNYQPTNLAPKQAAEIDLYPKCGILCAWDWPTYPDFWEVVGEKGVGVTYATFESKKLKLSPLGEGFKKAFAAKYKFEPPVYQLLHVRWDDDRRGHDQENQIGRSGEDCGGPQGHQVCGDHRQDHLRAKGRSGLEPVDGPPTFREEADQVQTEG